MRKLLLLTAALALLTACGQKTKIEGDPAPFQAAIADYLKAKSMDLAVRQLTLLKVTGEKAVAEADLTAADEGIAQVKVHWRFDFEKQPDGAWKATGHTVK